jgi:ribosomal protein S18 acetylase RimI-like enzyme
VKDGSEIAIVRASSERLDDLQPLWEALHRHHVEVAPELAALGPMRSGEASWRVRRAHYAELFKDEATFALIAEVNGGPVGYALVQMRGPEESWETGPVAELETLAVLPEARGEGIGSALVQAVFAELREMGIREWTVASIASNEEAHRFYKRFEVVPFTVSFIGKVPPG